jgi:alpha-glucosidase
MAVAEIAAEDQLGTMAAYTDGTDRYHTAYSFVFLRDALTPAHIRGCVEAMRRASPTAWPSWAFSNHDVVRAVSRFAGVDDQAALAKLLIAVLTCLRGTLFLYQGEELGLPHGDVPFARLQDPEGKTFWPRHKGRDGARTPMPWVREAAFAGFSTVEPWLPVDPAQAVRAVDRQDGDPASVLNFVRRFLRFRRVHPALVEGDIRFLDAPPAVLAFERAAPQERLLLAFNISAAPVSFELPAAARGRPLDGGGHAGVLQSGRVGLPAWGGLIVQPE